MPRAKGKIGGKNSLRLKPPIEKISPDTWEFLEQKLDKVIPKATRVAIQGYTADLQIDLCTVDQSPTNLQVKDEIKRFKRAIKSANTRPRSIFKKLTLKSRQYLFEYACKLKAPEKVTMQVLSEDLNLLLLATDACLSDVKLKNRGRRRNLGSYATWATRVAAELKNLNIKTSLSYTGSSGSRYVIYKGGFDFEFFLKTILEDIKLKHTSIRKMMESAVQSLEQA